MSGQLEVTIPRPASPVSVVLLARRGDEGWLARALGVVAGQAGSGDEVVVVAQREPALLAAISAVQASPSVVHAASGVSAAAMANRGAAASSAPWIALLQAGSTPGDGWLAAAAAAATTWPDAGALACALSTTDDDPPSSALSVARWGRVLPVRSPLADGDLVFAVSSRAGLFSRALLEEAGGFDEQLPCELADADLAVRGLLLGYRSRFAGAPQVTLEPGAALMLEERPEPPAADEARAWGEGRLKMLLGAMPREAWARGPQMGLELLADLYRSARDGRRPGALLRGLLRGALSARPAVGRRPRSRQADVQAVLEAFRASEQEMSHCRWQQAQGSLNRLLGG